MLLGFYSIGQHSQRSSKNTSRRSERFRVSIGYDKWKRAKTDTHLSRDFEITLQTLTRVNESPICSWIISVTANYLDTENGTLTYWGES